MTLRLAVCALLALPAAAAAGDEAGTGPAYLAYAGPYSSSPSSAFGHLFLILAAAPGEPAPLWDVVTFNAHTFGADPLRYLTIGIAGGFPGRFSRLQFHQKSREYELLDDRDLWLVELRLSAAQRAAIERALADASGRWYPYSFFQQNCAHYLQRLLADATGAVRGPSGLVSPAEVMGDVLASPLAGATFHRPAASRRIAAASAGVERAALDRLRREDWQALAGDLAFVDGLSPAARRVAQQWFTLRALEATSTLPEATRDGLARLRLRSVEAPPEPGAGPAIEGPGLAIAPPRFHRYTRLRLSFEAADFGPGRIGLALRGALHDEHDPSYGHQPINAMDFLSAAASTPADALAPRLDQAILFSQRALAVSSWVRRRRSWLLEALARRGGLFDEGVHLEARAGLGATLALPGRVHAYALATVAGVGRWDHGAALAPGVEAGVLALPFERWRAGARFTREHDAFQWSRAIQRVRGFARVDLGARLGLSLAAERTRGETTGTLALDAYL